MFRTFTRSLAVAASVGAVAAPAASAMLPPADTPDAQDAQPVVIEQPTTGGFDYGDAAIGAGLAFTVLLVGTGGGVALNRARRPQVSPGS
jgi:hypothetical protein